MRQDFVLYCRSCDKWQINNEPTTLPYGQSLTLPEPDEAYQSLAIDFAGPFNKSDVTGSWHWTLVQGTQRQEVLNDNTCLA